MAKQKNTKRAGMRWGFSPAVRSVVIHGLSAAVLLAGGGYLFVQMRKQVEQRLAFPSAAPTMVLKNVPGWMSVELAERIADGARPRETRSAMDEQLLHDVANILKTNAWVREVRQVRRVFGKSAGDTIEIDCEYRAPMALVATRSEYILVDGEGFRLPERFGNAQPPRIMFGEDGRVNLRIIEGVGALPPYQDGQRWVGQDLMAGLDLAKLLYTQEFAEEIHRINVANFNGRKRRGEAQLTLATKRGTEIRWGEPVKMTFHAELSPAEKIARLEKVYRQYGRIDGGHSWLDIRMDKVMYPAEESIAGK